MRVRLFLSAVLGSLALLGAGCDTVMPGPITLDEVVIQRDELPMAYQLVEETDDQEERIYRVVYALPDDSQIVRSEARRMDSREDAFEYLMAQADRMLAEGYEEERAKDMGDLNYSLSLLREDEMSNEYVMLFVEDDIAASVSVRGPRVIFGEMYALSRYMLHHIDNDHPTPTIDDWYSDDFLL
jgi:hypothetical protein